MRKDLKAQKEEATTKVCNVSPSSNKKKNLKKRPIFAYNLKSLPVTILINKFSFAVGLITMKDPNILHKH